LAEKEHKKTDYNTSETLKYQSFTTATLIFHDFYSIYQRPERAIPFRIIRIKSSKLWQYLSNPKRNERKGRREVYS